ncbi:conserved hypothetical protein [Leishmania infantum JPCM5]|uniref:IQ motif and ubiquitin-like domain-containing protein n=2 Tax=Leishmania infantum TaxID=5671 RepID=A4HZW4_LEIIN|nr:conserved hypothetical protein [Leishmania infantum JPCM5]CAC9488075.1 hypothetical_protein_-_conserved [Leishmania infantum]CAM68028.1 conserved hypothetical protein [Leishmania infantum JPCM5]SUZ41790.1 hypothetical_protein_-_conserved [Leishmania infantum]|eukprot:XP_001465605.1 conserved hypothetical protein [Leishmania infantum JPCM5]
MSDSADEFTGEPQPPLSDQSSMEEQEVPETMAAPPAQAEVDSSGRDSAVGHAVAPPRAAQREDSKADYAQLNAAEEDLAVNVAHDVRARPASSSLRLLNGGDDYDESPEYEEIPAAEDESGGVAGADSGSPLRAVSVTEHRNSATTAAATRQPTQGTQVDADVDLGEQHGQCGDDHGGASARAAAGSRESQRTADNASAAPHATKHQPVAPPRWGFLPQAPHGTVEVTVTLLPMRAVTRLTVPVRCPSMYRPTDAKTTAAAASGLNGSAGDGAGPHWILVVKDLFEGIADHLLVHPQSLRLFYQHKRLRFMETLFLDCDVTSAMAGRSGAGDDGGAAEGAANDRAEPIWIAATFPAAEEEHRAGAHGTALARDDINGEDEEAQASLMAVPAHLCKLGPDNYVARCIRIRPHKLEVPPQVLVEGRRQGYSYDEMIQRMQALQDVQQLPASHGGSGGDGAGDGASEVRPNFAIVAILQDGPVAPGKVYLGGYRDKRHPENVRLHAATQLYHLDLEYSPFAATKGLSTSRCTRQTQTLGISRSCQTHREVCVQTPRIDLLLDAAHDFIVVARPYFTAAELQALRVEMAIIIQKMYRQWKARRIRAELEAAEAARQHRAGVRQGREEALQMAVEDAAQLRRDDPRSAADFERLKQDVLNWRADEAARIQCDPSLSPAEVRAALLALTETELKLLQQLDQRRREVGKTRQERRFVQTLNRMAAPKQWGTVHVRTPETQRAAELRDLYERLCLTSSGVVAAVKASASSPSEAQGGFGSSPSPTSVGPMAGNVVRSPASASPSPWANTAAVGSALAATPTMDNAVGGLPSATAARLDILLRVKWTVREFSASSLLTQELCELVDREADLLHRGRKEASLASLRKRIQFLFAQFIEDPQYNPIAREFAQTARDRVRIKAAELTQEKAKPRKGQTTASV